MIEGLIRLEDAVMALNEDVAWLESEGAIGIDIVEMRNRVLEWLYELPTVPQKEYTEQQIRDTFNSGFSCGMEREWIDTEEEMPIDGQEVIASVYWTDYGDTMLAYGHYNARFDNWKLYSDSEGELIKNYEVVAWMPVPYPYTADHKTEPSDSEKPNNCETCRHNKLEWYSEVCDGCSKAHSNYEPKDEPKTQMKTQNSNLTFKTLEYCDICDHKGCEECIANALDEHCIPSQFKKQIEDECAKEYEELGLKELKELIEADRKTEPTISKMEQVEDEPQTDCAWGKYGND